MRIKLILTGVLLFAVIALRAQESPPGYNPFVPANLDDPAKLGAATVVEGSYHYYSITGDANYTDLSTFVWYAEQAVIGNYDPTTDTWTPSADAAAISNGTYVERLGVTNAEKKNASGIWVRWNDDAAGKDGYVAVYERSSDDCIFDQQITGFKHRILIPPEVWFLAGVREECTDQVYSVTAEFNELHSDAFPYILTYSYPGNDGVLVQKDTTLIETDLDASNQIHWDLEAVVEHDNTVDEEYTISLIQLRDNYGSIGNVAPRSDTEDQYSDITITILHLPQTGTMTME